MYDAIRELFRGDEFSIVEQFEIPGHTARYAPIPKFLFNSRIGLHLHRKFKEHHQENPLWVHQARALEALDDGHNVVVSTGTASGKSLVFQSLAFHKILLNSDSRVLVFYPLKALATDQFRGWQKMALSLGLEKFTIGRIDGTVPVKEREGILMKARIVVMTPDVCHAWLMYRLSSPVVSDFVRALSVLVMDEAHSLEGVFGSNVAFLIRRLVAARSHLLRGETKTEPLQLVAATATIKNPGEHMKRLTGLDFFVIDHEVDSAPQHERLITHVKCSIDDATQVAKALHDYVLDKGREGGFITFLDSRKGVEGLAMASGGRLDTEDVSELFAGADVLPYRAGYSAEEREQIEQRLGSGSLRGVVSTAALELGIDIPYLRVGFNIGVPWTRKAYRQRLGRIGRNGPGAFVVIAPQHAFCSYGTTFREYHDMSVEPSYLYLDNRFMQFAHARCLAVELEAIGAPPRTPPRTAWPSGFGDMLAAARPGGSRAPEYDAIAALGADTPHHGYPLRNIGEINFQLKKSASGDSFGDVSQLQALRECYPGAIYLHAARAYQVAAWHTNSFESFIRLQNSAPGRSTRPTIKKWINAGIAPADIWEGNYREGENGFLAECQMQITEKVEGYVDGHTGTVFSYQDLQQKNSNMQARSRNFRTSGVVLCIRKDWFKGSVKQAFADKLREVFVREYSVVSQDVDSAATNISIRNFDGGEQRTECIALYDETYGSLRLTEKLFLEFDHVLVRLGAAVAVDSEESLQNAVVEIQSEVSSFTDGYGGETANLDTPSGHEYIFTRGSRVCYQQAGQMATDVEVINATMMNGSLMYQVVVPPRPGQKPVKRWIDASFIEPSADASAWDHALWNRETEEYEDPPDNES